MEQTQEHLQSQQDQVQNDFNLGNNDQTASIPPSSDITQQKPLPNQQLFDKSKRPKVGLGAFILNEQDEVLVCQRIQPGDFQHNTWSFPGGHLEYGESFEDCIVREVEEECGVLFPHDRVKYLTTINGRGLHYNYHYVTLFMFTLVKKDEYNFINTEPTKQTDWRWVKWSEFVEYENLFNPFQYFFQQGFKDLNKVKQAAGLTQ
eukprot:403364314